MAESSDGLWASLVKKPKRKASVASADSSSGDESSEKQEGGEYFPASRLFEYQWPLGQENAEHYMLQEQVAEYLSIRDLKRRTLDVEEREYLVGRGAVTETLSNMGLVALCSVEVMEVMASDYPKKYEEFMDVLQEREFQATLRKKILETKRMAHRRQLEQENTGSYSCLLSAAVKQAAEYNAQLAKQRREERKAYFDTQTKVLQIPRPQLKPARRSPRRSRYPVALLPGQYSDYYQRYTAQELSRLPLKTVMEMPPKAPSPPPSTSAHDVNSAVGMTTEPSMITTSLSAPPHSSSPVMQSIGTRMEMQTRRMSAGFPRSFVCSVCYKGRGSNAKGQPEELLQCTHCGSHTHPSCLGMSQTAVVVAKTYSWQCLECKKCQVCSDPGEEEAMVFCDECDRGYHSFCVGINTIPSGVWLCPLCGQCASCDATTPGKEPGNKWKHEYANGKFIHTLCMDCSSFFRRGCFCPVCLQVYHNDESDSPMVCCDACDRWIHTDCDNISDDFYKELSKDNSTYTCVLCRGEERERVDTFHKKYRKTTVLSIPPKMQLQSHSDS